MARSAMTGRERILTAIRHEEPDRVPISPRVGAWMNAEFGDEVTLKGYVDLLYVLKHGTPELVAETVREAMEIAKPGGGFIIGSSDSFREGTPPENLEAYWRACLQYGRYE